MKIKNLLKIKKSLPANVKETLMFNKTDSYIDMGNEANLDLSNGCLVIADVVADVLAEPHGEVAADITVDIAVEKAQPESDTAEAAEQ